MTGDGQKVSRRIKDSFFPDSFFPPRLPLRRDVFVQWQVPAVERSFFGNEDAVRPKPETRKRNAR
jgi:hypothetical protein